MSSVNMTLKEKNTKKKLINQKKNGPLSALLTNENKRKSVSSMTLSSSN